MLSVDNLKVQCVYHQGHNSPRSRLLSAGACSGLRNWGKGSRRAKSAKVRLSFHRIKGCVNVLEMSCSLVETLHVKVRCSHNPELNRSILCRHSFRSSAIYAWSASAPEISNLLAGNRCTNHTPAVATHKFPPKFPAEDSAKIMDFPSTVDVNHNGSWNVSLKFFDNNKNAYSKFGSLQRLGTWSNRSFKGGFYQLERSRSSSLVVIWMAGKQDKNTKATSQNIQEETKERNDCVPHCVAPKPPLHTVPRPILVPTFTPFFVYGTLMSMPILAKLITGDERNVQLVLSRVEKALVFGYSRRAVRDEVYPAAIKGKPGDFIPGLLYKPGSWNDIRRLTRFENTSFRVETVDVMNSRKQRVKAFIWMWGDSMKDLEELDWSLRDFESQWLLNAMLTWK